MCNPHRTVVLVPLICLFANEISGSRAIAHQAHQCDPPAELLGSVWECDMDGPGAIQPITVTFHGDKGEFTAWAQPSGRSSFKAELLNIKYCKRGGSFEIAGDFRSVGGRGGQFRWLVSRDFTWMEGTTWYTETQSNCATLPLAGAGIAGLAKSAPHATPGTHGRLVGKRPS